MSRRNPKIPDSFFSSFYLMRALLYTNATVLAIGLTVVRDTPVIFPIMMSVFTTVAWIQRSSRSLLPAWATDLLASVVVAAWLGHSPAGFGMVVGWGGLVGLVGAGSRWFYSAGTSIAAGLVAGIVSGAEDPLATAIMNGFGAAAIAAFFVFVSWRVGELMRAGERERERLASVVDSASDLIVLTGRGGAARYVNAAALEWVREHDITGGYEAVRDSLASNGAVERAVVEHSFWIGHVDVAGGNGVRVLSVVIQVFDFDGEETIAAIARDVTAEIEKERQLEDLVRAKDELVASISHEIRTPLTVVLGLAAELRDSHREFGEETRDELTGLIVEQGQEMANIVEDLLVQARTDTDSLIYLLSAIDLEDEIAATLRSLPAGEAREIVGSVDVACWADPSRVRQILRNLIANARRYGGEHVSIAAEEDGDVVRLYVRDDGVGVPDDEVDTIFEPFGRAHPSGTQPGSIGLGLSVSRDLGRRMGGDIEYSRDDGETVFTLTLPSVTSAVASQGKNG